MLFVHLIVGWLFKTAVGAESFQPVEVAAAPGAPTPSQRGYRFEHDQLKRLMIRMKRWETISFTDKAGTPLSPDTIEGRWSRDGGIDAVIHIVTPTEAGARIVQGKLLKILESGDY